MVKRWNAKRRNVSNMSRKILNSISGLSNEIGFYLGGMEEVSERLHEAVKQ